MRLYVFKSWELICSVTLTQLNSYPGAEVAVPRIGPTQDLRSHSSHGASTAIKNPLCSRVSFNPRVSGEWASQRIQLETSRHPFTGYWRKDWN